MAGDLIETLYAGIVDEVVRVSTTQTAEAVKITENIFRAVNIALVNELKLIYDKMGTRNAMARRALDMVRVWKV